MKRVTVKEKVRNYAFMTAKPFTYKALMADLGLPKRTASHAIRALREAGEIVNIGRPHEGIYRIATERQRAELEAEKRKAALQDMRDNGDKYFQMLREAI